MLKKGKTGLRFLEMEIRDSSIREGEREIVKTNGYPNF